MCKMGMKFQESAEALLHNQNENTNTISGPRPMLDRRGPKCRQVMQEPTISLKNWQKFVRHREVYVDIREVR